MEQFSHDLTLALEETSRIRAGHYWGGRRRTRSTGNLRKLPVNLRLIKVIGQIVCLLSLNYAVLFMCNFSLCATAD